MLFKKVARKGDKTDLFHPSWVKRMEYLSYKVFDEKLIRKIATDVGFDDEAVIQAVIEFYRKDSYLKLK